MIKITPIVEGHGEVKAVPTLLKRKAQEVGIEISIQHPIRASASQMIKDNSGQFGIEKQIELALRNRDTDVIFIFIDGDNIEKICEFYPKFYAYCIGKVPETKMVCIVFPNKEFESWFLSSITELAPNAPDIQEPETIRGAKERFKNSIPGKKYHESLDQEPYTKKFSFELARAKCRSFKKFEKEFNRLLSYHRI